MTEVPESEIKAKPKDDAVEVTADVNSRNKPNILY